MKSFRTILDSALVLILVIALGRNSVVLMVAAIVLASLSLGLNIDEMRGRRRHE